MKIKNFAIGEVVGLVPILACLILCSLSEDGTKKPVLSAAEQAGKKEYDKQRAALDTAWRALPDTVRKNRHIIAIYDEAGADLDRALMRVSTSAMLDVYSNHTLRLLQAAELPEKYHATTAESKWVVCLIDNICPGNNRARFHVCEANLDLDEGVKAGFSLDLLKTARAHLEVAAKLVEDPFEVPKMSEVVSVRDRLEKIESALPPLTALQARHLAEGRKFVLELRATLANYGNDAVMVGMAQEHLSRAVPGTVEPANSKIITRMANLFERVIEIQDFVHKNCADNEHAVLFVDIAAAYYRQWRTELCRTFWYEVEESILREIEMTRVAILSKSRKGVR